MRARAGLDRENYSVQLWFWNGLVNDCRPVTGYLVSTGLDDAIGGPGDHPLSDVVHYDLEVYGNEADGLLKKLAPLLSERELREWWEKEIGWNCSPQAALDKIRARLSAAESRAGDSGWELD